MATVREIVVAHLRQIGADGLCAADCGCGLDDLAPCNGYAEIPGDCEPARRQRQGARSYNDASARYVPMEPVRGEEE